MVNSSEFADRLQEILDYYGLSATAFSDKIDFNRSTISHLLSGRNKPSLDFVMKVWDAFPEVELYWLLNGKGSFPASEKSTQRIQTPKSQTGGTDVEEEEKPRETPPNRLRNTNRTVSDEEIDRIVIFYKDGTFRSYR